MARRRRSTRRRATRRRASTARRGFAFLPPNALAAVGGVAAGSIAVSMLGPRIAQSMPQLASSTIGRVAVSAAIGALGYVALRRVNSAAAAGVFAGALAPEVISAVNRMRQGSAPAAPAVMIQPQPAMSGYLPDPTLSGYLPEGVNGYGSGRTVVYQDVY